ncbi:phospholipase D/nuclease [Xylariaceae sp. FL0804]|nr:phospholipase D/nuclease [Xylariaceae sp. FL0804]
MEKMEHLLHKAEHALKEVLRDDEDDKPARPAAQGAQGAKPDDQSHWTGPEGVEKVPINTNHRYQSFQPQTTGNAKWFVDGASYFYAVSLALERARQSIWILDWWLSPELYLRRLPSNNEQYRLDNMLRAAAERGVEVRVIVYKEVTQALTLDSLHTKHALEKLHPNIKVFRHPDHLPTNTNKLEQAFDGLSLDNLKMNAFNLSKVSGNALKELYGSFGDSVLYWAHHEKLCIVDRHTAFMGGLDMCFGRWDTNSHPIADAHPGNMNGIIFPGQDFNNARVFDFEGVQKWDHNQLDRAKASRMGWSDVALSLHGPIVVSLLDHFVDRWNYIYSDKYTETDDGKYRALSTRGAIMGGEGAQMGYEGQEGHRHHLGDLRGRFNRHMRQYMGVQDEEEDGERGYRDGEDTIGHPGGINIQLCRSVCQWSGGHPTEHSIANAYINAIESAQHFVYIENQFFITATGDKQHPIENKIGASIVSRIVRAFDNGEDFKVIVLMPAVPAFAGDLHSDAALGTRAIMEYQYNSISRGGHSIIECLQRHGIEDWRRYIGFYNLRNYDRINVSSAMREAEEESGVRYGEAAQQYDDMMGRDDEGGTRDQFDRYQSAASHHSNRTWDTVSSCYMEGGTDIREVPWNGSEEAEMDAFVTEELYIHTKVLIADDRLVICGSANLNDRSQLGTHDSEIAVVIQDPETVESTMNGQPYTASKFAASLRRQLWRKHLGLIPDQPWDRPTANWTPVTRDPQEYDWGSRGDKAVEDPLSEHFWRLWTSTARTNTAVFTKVFHPVPNDHCRNWDEYEDFFGKRFVIPGVEYEDDEKRGRVEYGHVVRDEFQHGAREVKEWLARVRGTLVEMPLDFLVEVKEMAKEGLSLNAFTDEIYT